MRPDGRAHVMSVLAALHGAGLAMAHDTVASDLLARGALVRPYTHTVAMSEAYFLTAPPRHGETPASRMFVQWLLDETARSGTRLRQHGAASPGSDSTMGGVGAPETCMEATANDEVPSDPSRLVGSAERD